MMTLPVSNLAPAWNSFRGLLRRLMPRASTIEIRAVVSQKGTHWVAQCLEYDIAAQADSLAELRQELESIITTHLEIADEKNSPPFVGLPRAPDYYFRVYERLAMGDSAARCEDMIIAASDLARADLHLAYI